MSVFEIILLGVALAMDAVAVGMSSGMANPKMKGKKVLEMAGAFGLFQFFMPLVGYCAGEVFSRYVSAVAPMLSFLILAFLGGKMILGCIKEMLSSSPRFEKKREDGALKLLLQALATSIDALAVGITLLALETTGTLALPTLYASLIIGVVTFLLSAAAVFIGKKAGALVADKAEILGGVVLIFIGVKVLLEGVL